GHFPLPYPDHLVTIGRGKPSGPIAGFVATYGLGGRISGGLGHKENSRWHKRGGLPWGPVCVWRHSQPPPSGWPGGGGGTSMRRCQARSRISAGDRPAYASKKPRQIAGP